MIKLWCFLFYFAGCIFPLAGQFNLQVQVLDAVNNGVLEDCYVKVGDQTGFTDLQGRVQFSLASGDSLLLACRYSGYTSHIEFISLKRDTNLTVKLSPRSVLLTEAEVLADPLNSAADLIRNQVLVNSIKTKNVNSTPSMLGEPDALRNISFISGVQPALPGGAGLYVRGGDLYHNAIFLDNIPIFNANHAFGYASPFAPGTTEKVDFYKQAFPAQFQGALASVMDIKAANANLRQWSGQFAGGFGSLRGQIGIPIKKDVSSINLSSRVSTFNIINAALPEQETIIPNFDDHSIKLFHRLSDHETLELIGYLSRDGITQKQPVPFEGEVINFQDRFSVYSLASGFRYSHQAEHWFQQHQVFFSNYGFQQQYGPAPNAPALPASDDEILSTKYITDIQQWGYKNSFERPFNKGRLKLGIELNILSNHEPVLSYRQGNERFQKGGGYQGFLLPAAFGSYQYQINDRWDLEGGLRLSYAGFNTADNLLWQPRLNSNYALSDNLALFMAFDRSASFFHRFRNNYYGTALDLPFIAGGDLPAATMEQFSGGGVFSERGFNASLSAFYRHYQNVTDRDYTRPQWVYGDDENLGGALPPVDFREGLVSVDGYSYGIETDVNYAFKIYRFNASYTWSRAYRQAEELNQGAPYPFEFNQEHLITMRGFIRFKRNKIDKVTEIGLAYTYGSGRFTQFGVQQQMSPPLFRRQTVGYIPERNNAQLPAMQHLDVVFNFIAQKKRGVRVFTISVFNVLAMPIITQYSSLSIDSDNRGSLMGVGPWRIIPTISYSYQF